MYFYLIIIQGYFITQLVGGLETFLKNLSSVWDIFHEGF